jgi:hypothetical protein
VTDAELDLLIAGLGELPTKLSFNMVNKLARIKTESQTPSTGVGTTETGETKTDSPGVGAAQGPA